MKKPRVFIDVAALCEPKLSGIGHVVLETVRHLSTHKDFKERYEMVLVIPKGGVQKIANYHLGMIRQKELDFRSIVLSMLEKYHLLPPMDLILGEGIYIFPNYKNWPLLFSRSITYIHDLAFMRYPETVEPRNLKNLLKGVPRWAKRTDVIATISKFSKREIEQLLGFDGEKVALIYPGVDSKLFCRQEQDEITKFQQRHKLPNDYVLYFGNLEPRKNVSRLLHAYRSLPEELKCKHPLVIAGSDGWLNEDTIELLNKLKKEDNIIRVREHMKDSELPALYSGASVLAHPAIYEGFGLSVLQAAACGTTVITSNIASLPEVGGSYATYFDPTATKEISAALKKALSKPRVARNSTIAGMKRAELFSWEKSTNSLKSVIDQLADLE